MLTLRATFCPNKRLYTTNKTWFQLGFCYREEELTKLGEEAEVNDLKFTEEMQARLQDKVTDTMEARPTLPPA